MSIQPRVALSQDFLRNLSRLPSQVQAKILKWAIKFQADPKGNGINYETINAAADPNLRSVRIDQDWRGIVFKPPVGDLYVLLYVDHHDDAYHWASHRKMAINPVTGAMQIVCLESVVEQVSVPAPAQALQVVGLYVQYSDHELMSLGVPEELLLTVRKLVNADELDAVQAELPVEAYEGLFLLAAGDTLNQILMSRETRVDQVIDTSDFIEAIKRAESLSRFVLVDSDDSMTAILNAPLAQWRVFLHPTQRKLSMGPRSGPMRVLGGAGTGKTVLAMHRAKWLAEQSAAANRKVLFTTFTRNLAFDIESNLKSFCPLSVLERIEVKNLDAWVHGFLRHHRYEHKILYNRKKEGADAWACAMAIKPDELGLDEGFYERELEDVVLAQGIDNLDDYRAARRAGRKVILSRSKRDAIWPVFEEYRSQLSSRQLKEVDDAYRDAARLLEEKPESLYSSVIVDETQDFGPQALRLIRAMVAPGENDLFFVGDGHQRIYKRNTASMSRCGINIRGRSRKLYLNYRTTDEIRKQAVALLEGCEIDDLDDGKDDNSRYKSLSHGPAPILESFSGLEQALSKAVEVVNVWGSGQQADSNNLATTCVMAGSQKLRDALAQHFASKGFAISVLDATAADTAPVENIRFATMHRAKGLEFDHVIVVADALLDENMGIDPRLVYVAMTRAKVRAALLQA